MGANSKIEWTDHTFNPWWGCMKVSPACDHCYAESFAKRTGHEVWGAKATYRTFAEKHWSEPRKWNRLAAAAGERRRVFCASMADVFDNRAPAGERDKLWALIRETPNLDWLLLTKRPQNIAKMLPADWGAGYPNVWLGTTVENQEEADRRIPHLRSVPAAIRFLSCEPLLGPLDLRDHFWPVHKWFNAKFRSYEEARDAGGSYGRKRQALISADYAETLIDWVIVGGESGHGARIMQPSWVESIREQCADAEVPFLFKQWGDWSPMLEIGASGWELTRRDESGKSWGKLSSGGFGDEPMFDGRSFETVHLHEDPLIPCMVRVGKKIAGRQFYRRTWDGFPKVEAA